MIYLKNERLEAQIAEPKELYTATRFDGAGIVRQITLDETHTFLSEESAVMTAAKNGGIGITGSFEPAPAVFLQNVEYAVEQPSETEVVFTGTTDKVRCSKKLSLKDNTLEITHTVQNMGEEAFSFGEYNHNFMLIDKHPYGPEYALDFLFAPQLTERKEGYYNRFNLQGRTLTVTETFSEPPEDALTQITGFAGQALPWTWELVHVPSGLYVREADDFPIWKYQLWCRRDNVCSEIFFKQKLEAEESVTWKRVYTFGRL